MNERSESRNEEKAEHKKLSELRGFKGGAQGFNATKFVTAIGGDVVDIISITAFFALEDTAFSMEVAFTRPGSEDVHTYTVSGPITDADSLRSDLRGLLDTFEKLKHGDHRVIEDEDTDGGMGWAQ